MNKAVLLSLLIWMPSSNGAPISLADLALKEGIPLLPAKPFVLKNPGWDTSSAGKVAEGENGSRRLRIRILESKDFKAARSHAQMHRQVMESAYDTRPSPYMAAVTDKVRCGSNFKPRSFGSGEGRFVSVPVTARLAYGVCDPSEAKQMLSTAFFFDREGSRLIQVDLVEPYPADPGRAFKFMKALWPKDNGYKNITSGGPVTP